MGVVPACPADKLRSSWWHFAPLSANTRVGLTRATCYSRVPINTSACACAPADHLSFGNPILTAAQAAKGLLKGRSGCQLPA